jgi:serine/threonine protein kinase
MSEPPDPSRRWTEIESLFEAAVELPPEARDTFLASIRDEALRLDVRSLLAHHAPDGTFISAAIGHVAGEFAARADAAAASGATLAGLRIGAYQVTGVLGQGGMGAVYRARRADGQFEQDVAIKLVRHGFRTPAALDRFRQERQILARLTHAGIARLLDGGTSPDEAGVATPYLVMEYVAGESVTSYCARTDLSTPGRVRLFRLVCHAVEYAHEQLIVHRDLKPANILVTADGQPKLLDFGIAKLLTDPDGDLSSRTSTGMHLLTPDYASPEQVTGEPVTAASDIYSLGALLYELLTGQKAHRFRTLSPVEIGRVVCDTEPVKPSAAVPDDAPGAARLRRQLDGDLDTIVLKALQKDPSRRYRSVEQLSEDLRRYLEGLPVLARPDTVAYRTSKFVRRNRWALAGATVVAASLVVGTVLSVWQARRAERRFEQVRTLANSLIYDVHDEIQNLPGSTTARQKIVTTALGYLNGLEREAAGDPRLERDLATAYVRVGDVQGGVLDSNLGDVAGALESYRRARDLFARDSLPDAARQLASVEVKMGNALSYHGDLSAALEAYARAQSVLEPVAGAAGASDDDLEQLATVYQSMARVLGLQRDSQKSLETSERVLTLRRSLMERNPDNDPWVDALAGAEAEVSMALQRMGRPHEALPHAKASLALRERIAADQTNNASAQRRLILSYSHVADILGNPTMPSLGDAAGAIEIYRRMTAVAERLVTADASDRRATWDLANCLLRLGSALVPTGARDEAIGHLERAARLMRDIASAEPANNRVRVTLAFVERRIGDALSASGRLTDALGPYDEAIRLSEAVLAADPDEGSIVLNLSGAHDGRALALARAGRHEAAVRHGLTAIDVIERARAARSGNTRTVAGAAQAYAAMGRIHHAARASGSRAEGCRWFEKSLQTYRDLLSSGPLDAQTTADMEAVSRDAAGCRLAR